MKEGVFGMYGAVGSRKRIRKEILKKVTVEPLSHCFITRRAAIDFLCSTNIYWIRFSRGWSHGVRYKI